VIIGVCVSSQHIKFVEFSALRSDFAKRTRSPLSISAIATMPVSQQQQQQQQQQQSQHVQQPPPQPVQSSRMPLADLSNVTFRAPSTTNDAVGNNMRSASSAALPELSSFVSMSYSTTPLQSFAARLRRPQTPSRVRRSMAPFNS
jgi:hypothetical protein